MATGIVPQVTQPATDFVPEVFGRLTTLDAGFLVTYGDKGKRTTCHRVRCMCGKEKQVRRSDLVSGSTRSCGCLREELTITRSTIHGHIKKKMQSPEYTAYWNMVSRCYNPNHPSYPDYGGRGIKVFPEWLGPGGFERWLAYMGPRPKGRTQDRFPNPEGNYEPGNVRWATAEEQANNKRSNVVLTYKNETKTQAQWSVTTGLSQRTISGRLKAGWDVAKALETPSRKKKATK